MQTRPNPGTTKETDDNIINLLDFTFDLIQDSYQDAARHKVPPRPEIVDELRRVLRAAEQVRALVRSYLYAMRELRVVTAADDGPASQLPDGGPGEAVDDVVDPLEAWMTEQGIGDPQLRR